MAISKVETEVLSRSIPFILNSAVKCDLALIVARFSDLENVVLFA